MVKVLSLRFQQCFGPFTMLLVKESSETELFRHLPNHVFRSPSVQRCISCEGHLFLKIFKFEYKFRKCKKEKKKNSENIFRFLDNCLWKCCNKLPLLRREYLWSEVNGLKKSPKILHIIKRDFFNLNCLHSEK